MSGVVSNGIFFNTDSGLTPFLDRLTALADRDAQQRDQLSGIAPALRATGIPVGQPSGGFLSGLANFLPGLFGTGQQQSDTAAPASSSPATNAAPAGPAPTASTLPPANAVASYIGQAAQARGIDPMTALRVASSEGGFSPGRMGDDNSSAGPFQLHYGGVAPGGNQVAGLGDDFTAKTGLDARDPANWKAAVDFALDNAAKSGWGSFHGAAKAGISQFAGIPAQTDGAAPAAAASTSAAPGASAGQAIANATPGAAPMPIATAGTNVTPTLQNSDSSGTPLAGGMTRDALAAMIANPASRQLGLQIWQQSLSPKTTVFGKPGEVAFSNGRPTYQVPATPMAVKANETIVDPTTHQPIYTAPGKDIDIKQTGEDPYGNKVFSTIDKTTGQITPIQAPAGASGQGAGNTDPNLHGQDFLATLNPTIAAQVQAYAEGRSKMPSGVGANSPFARQMRAAVLQYDPNFDASNTDARFKTRLDFSPGGGPNSAGVAITAGNTAIQHLGELSDAAEEMNNSRLPAWNYVAQTAGGATGGNLAGRKFATALQNYTDEITKFYRGTGGTEAEIQDRKNALSSISSPDQLRTAIATEVDLLRGKINALQDRWHQGMGPNVADFPIIQSKTQAALDRIAGRSPAGGASAPTAAPNAGAGAAKTINGVTYTQGPDGQWYTSQ